MRSSLAETALQEREARQLRLQVQRQLAALLESASERPSSSGSSGQSDSSYHSHTSSNPHVGHSKRAQHRHAALVALETRLDELDDLVSQLTMYRTQLQVRG